MTELEEVAFSCVRIQCFLFTKDDLLLMNF
jgi:hypothetical protein